jgi:hypothetical protein
MVAEIILFESLDLSQLDFCLWGWMMSEGYKKNGYKRRIAGKQFGHCCLRKET